jgi:putative alpha-1,2-mannosidase
VPGSDVLAVGSPLFPRATLHLANGDVRISARGAARDAPYVQRLAVNGRRHAKPWLRWADVAHGGTLAFALGQKPNRRWGSAPAAAPPSFGPTAATACGTRATRVDGLAG